MTNAIIEKIIKISLIKYVGGFIGGELNENIPSVIKEKSKFNLFKVSYPKK